MAEVKPGWQTSEGRLTAIGGILALVGEHVNLFDVAIIADDPVLMLIYRVAQLLVVGTLVGIYTISRSRLKAENGAATEDLASTIQRNLDQKR